MAELKPFFSVVIPTYNRGARLARTLDSLNCQTFTDFEVLVMDDGSTDNTVEILTRFPNLNLRYTWALNSGGPATPRNRGIDAALGEWICFLDADDVWFSHKLETIYATISRLPEVNVVGHDENMVHGEKGVAVRLRFGLKQPDLYRAMLVRGNCCSTSTMSIRRDLLNQHGLRFNVSPDFVIVEDYDLWLNLARVGAKFHFVNVVLSDYLVSQDNISLNWDRAIRNLETLLRYHVYRVQTFETNRDRLWHQVRFQVDLSRMRVAWRARREMVAFGRAIQMALSNPVRFIQHSFAMWNQLRTTKRSVPRMSPQHFVVEKLSQPFRATKSLGRSIGLIAPNSLRVLLYHDVPPDQYTQFAAQLRWLAEHYRFVTPVQFAAMMSGGESCRGKNLLVTFDDGFASNRIIAEQVLNPMGISALFFVVSAFVDIDDIEKSRRFIAEHIAPGMRSDDLPRHWRNMRWDDLEALLEQGHVIGSHSHMHSRLSGVSDSGELAHEIAGSADLLVKRLRTPIEHFAFPFGDIKSFSEAAMMLARQRFRYIHSGLRGDNFGGVSPFAVRRDGASFRLANNEYAVLSNNLIAAFVEGAGDPHYSSSRRQLDSWCAGLRHCADASK
jgi:glycosyltransferase involved in cell wall biosynthesis/peptidoglycan/xylan/chitin deacetylase (PgdA/CDA1 family)